MWLFIMVDVRQYIIPERNQESRLQGPLRGRPELPQIYFYYILSLLAREVREGTSLPRSRGRTSESLPRPTPSKTKKRLTSSPEEATFILECVFTFFSNDPGKTGTDKENKMIHKHEKCLMKDKLHDDGSRPTPDC